MIRSGVFVRFISPAALFLPTVCFPSHHCTWLGYLSCAKVQGLPTNRSGFKFSNTLCYTAHCYVG